ncbi:MAG: phosphoribosylglycinamide synthetase C domain-containing protein [Patescibacteria group bacterium]
MAEFKVLLIGSGGREYAYLRKLLQASEVFVHVAPGLSGMLYFLNEEERSRVKLYPEVKATDVKAILQLAQTIMPDLVVVGPETPLIFGQADELLAKGLKVVGFTAKGAELENNKAMAKAVYQQLGEPTAPGKLVLSLPEAIPFIEQCRRDGIPLACKTNHEAAGKGVIVPSPEGQDGKDHWTLVEETLVQMFDPKKPLGFLSKAVLLEHCYRSLREWSAMYLLGKNGFCLPWMPTKDHKLLHGNNTGGMGIVTPAPGFSMADMNKRLGIIAKVRQYLADRFGIELCGILYEGLNRIGLIDYLLETNIRGGDPETQAQLEYILGVAFHELLLAACEGNTGILSQVKVPEDMVSVGVVMASTGYPGDYSAQKGKEIIIPRDLPENVIIHPAGLVLEDNKLKIAGGRVLMVSAKRKTIPEARDIVYKVVKEIQHDGALDWREDIGIAA